MNPLLEKYPEDQLYDTMTKAFRKEIFLQVIAGLIKEEHPFSLYFLDFDNFKEVNDTKGHLIGDKALIDIAKTVRENIPEEGMLFRFGGDEFSLIVPDAIAYQKVWEIARNYSEAVRKRHYDYLSDVFPGGRATLTSGIARYPLDADNQGDLLSLADRVLYRGKEKGKNCFIIYRKDIHNDIAVHQEKGKDFPLTLLNGIYQDFTGKDIVADLTSASERIGKNFAIARISLQTAKTSHLLYQDPKMVSAPYHPYPKEDFPFSKEETYGVFYKSVGEKEHKPYSSDMEKNGVHTSLLFRVKGKEGEGFYRIDSRRDRVFTEDELFLFQTIADLYTLIETQN